MSLAFDFGANWREYSRHRLDESRLAGAVDSMADLLGQGAIAGRTVVDVGCGSGLFSIAAAKAGASRTLGFDINSTGIRICEENAKRLLDDEAAEAVRFEQGSALDAAYVGGLGTFDIVYAWGSLHHTGDMYNAIRNAVALVGPEGSKLVLAIYNRHWSSPLWTLIKRAYNLTPRFLRFLWEVSLGSVMYLAVWIAARENPFKKARGMDFRYDVIDWLGGYPYEYASAEEVKRELEPLGFRCVKVVPPRSPTGCNEMVFEKVAS